MTCSAFGFPLLTKHPLHWFIVADSEKIILINQPSPVKAVRQDVSLAGACPQRTGITWQLWHCGDIEQVQVHFNIDVNQYDQNGTHQHRGWSDSFIGDYTAMIPSEVFSNDLLTRPHDLHRLCTGAPQFNTSQVSTARLCKTRFFLLLFNKAAINGLCFS